MKRFDRAYAKIHLDHIRANMEAMQKNLSPGTKMIGVVKADGYGHGAVPVAKTIDEYVTGFAVAAVEEAFQLRKNGIDKDILVLGVTPGSLYQEAIEQKISMTVFRLEWAKALSELACKLGTKAKIHIAVDTGMNRIGFMPTKESANVVKKISELPGIELEGMFTHFARADETDKTCTYRQMERFTAFVHMVNDLDVQIPMVHCSNSAGIVELKEAHMDAVRAGITVYGLYPSDEVDHTQISLKPAMELKSFISYIKEIEAGAAVSYGGRFVAETSMRIGTVSIGYADGYPRNVSGKGSVLICGKRVPILGRVCMDQLMIDLSQVPEAEEGSEVTLLGWDGEEKISMEELAETCGGFHYEIPCVIGKRIPRVYVCGDQVVGAQYFEDCVYEGF